MLEDDCLKRSERSQNARGDGACVWTTELGVTDSQNQGFINTGLIFVPAPYFAGRAEGPM